MTAPNPRPRIRLFVNAPLGAGMTVPLSKAQSHYLSNVMRLRAGDLISVFNGRDGEWRCRIEQLAKKSGEAIPEERIAPQGAEADLWLLLAPLKKNRLDYAIEKAVELGVSRLCPTTTQFTSVRDINRDRLVSHAREAAEQCGRLSVPEVERLEDLDRRLSAWPNERSLIYCDEFGDAPALADFLTGLPEDAASKPWAILIGPEGGFSQSERRVLRERDGVTPVSLGPLVLRADTAAVASIALWQSLIGQWRSFEQKS